ncbi:type I-G CRISPR-associated protein Cas7 [Flaviflexus massiliensis]|uniref:type I-G CRISPR-associated protein Cas7 n=1 Tax=Flaviflexus massiliensis TaxID=1522309 RepID=UPI0006D5922D|nr:type I-U CRISPR-associated protein Cas7 [Flaviflexus massiliensis]
MSTGLPNLTLEDLLKANSPGGSSVLTSVTELSPAGGPHATVAPGRYLTKNGSKPTYNFGIRFIDNEPKISVVIDSGQSQTNRGEEAVNRAREDSFAPLHSILSRIPTIEVDYGGKKYNDLTLPHRGFDAHIRAGKVGDIPVTADESYRAARDSNHTNARALMDLSPYSLVNGSWDATRKSNQGRYRSTLESEIIGILADQSTSNPEPNFSGGARVDPVAASVQLDQKTMTALADAQRHELSKGNYDAIIKEAKSAGKGVTSASRLGLGAIPPTLETLGGVACSQIIRSHVLSFATLRQLRFGLTPEGDIARRAVLAALGLVVMALADDELYIRANCNLVELDYPTVMLDERYGRQRQLAPITVELAGKLLEEAIEHATNVAELDWTGQVFEVVGDPTIIASASDNEAGDE